MAYPPELPPSNRTDSTISAVNHASDHNRIAAALRSIVDVLGAAPAKGYADLSSRLADFLSSGQVDARISQGVEDQVGPRIDEHLAENPTVVAEAAALAQSTAGLVRKTDPGVTFDAVDDGTHVAVWRTKLGRRLIAAITAAGRVKAKGFEYLAGSRTTETATGRGASAYLRATVATSGGSGFLRRLAEDALLADGTVPQWVLDRWSSRMSFAAGILFGTQRIRDVSASQYATGTVGAPPAGRHFRPLAEDTISADGTVPQWVLDRWANRLPGLGAIQYPVLVVRPNPGPGEFATWQAANASITDSSARKQYTILVTPGDYVTSDPAQLDHTPKDYVSIVGTERGACIIGGRLPDNSTDTNITGLSAMRPTKTLTLANLTIVARNMRYVVHSESSGVVKDYVQNVDNCDLIHEGNQGAIDWRAANPSQVGAGFDRVTVWTATRPWGYGASSGGRQRFRNTKMVGTDGTVWYMHDREDWDKGGEHVLEWCELYSSNAAPYLELQSLGSGRETLVLLRDCATNALAVRYSDSPWISTTPAQQVANHAQIRAAVGGSERIGFTTTARGRALRIESTDTTAASTVRVTGTAADALMGVVIPRDYGWGVKGYAFGRWDVSGILTGINSDTAVTNTMGKRLGDCTTTPKTMSVVINGGAPIVVTFNGNHTADSDATILGIINTALGSAGAATVYDVVAGEEYPNFPDRETGKVNREASTTIRRWSAVKLDANGVKVMQTSDPASAFYGVALENIAPGKVGRILHRGRLASATQVRGISGTTIAVGATIYHSDSTAGEFATSGTRVAMTGAHTAGWADF